MLSDLLYVYSRKNESSAMSTFMTDRAWHACGGTAASRHAVGENKDVIMWHGEGSIVCSF